MTGRQHWGDGGWETYRQRGGDGNGGGSSSGSDGSGGYCQEH